MKRLFSFRSIYARFAVIFLGIWWGMNMLAFGTVFRIISGSSLIDMHQIYLKHAAEMDQLRRATGQVFLASTVIGTILILLAVRQIVKPIRRLSKATGQIAGGDFSVRLQPAARDEIGRLTDDFNQMASSLQNIEILRKDFVANVSHEFKTPITAIRGYASLIGEGGLPEDQMRDYARLIASESRRLAHLSTSLMRLSELDANLVREQAREYALDEQIRQTILLLEHQWSPKQLDFDIELDPLRITAPEHLLQEVWLNLISNAIKFSPAGGAIRISLTARDERACFEVADHGCGIRAEDQPRIFERFFVADKSRSQDSNGIGLAIVRKVVEITGGAISFTSEPGSGSVFTVVLPLRPIQSEVHHVRKN